MKADPAKGIKDAVILEQRLRFNGRQVEYLVRIRILNESGRRAADFTEFGADAHSFEGRTVYPDGKEVVFNSRKDFSVGKSATVGGTDIKRTVMIPPGVTSDCVVEVRWRESADHSIESPIPERCGYMGEWRLGSEYPILESVVEIPTIFAWNFSLFPGATMKPEVSEKGGYKTFVFRNMPAFEETPYSLPVTRPVPTMTIFYQPEALRYSAGQTSQAYWNRAADAFLKDWLVEDVRINSSFKAFVKELTTGLMGSPQAQAQGLLRRLEGRIKNWNHLTFEEVKSSAKVKRYPGDLDLAAAIELGAASSRAMPRILYQLLKAADLKPKFALVADRDVRIMKPNQLCLFQFTQVLLGVDEPGKSTLWLDASLRFANPGMVHPDYQGTRAAVVDPATWTVSWETILPQPAAYNRREYRYRLDLDETEDRFSFDTTFAGYPEYAERYRFISLEPKEQGRLLKEELEGFMKQASFTKAEVQNATDTLTPFRWHVEGTIPREEGRRREVYPFPGMGSPLAQPAAWPETRTDMIVMPYMRTHAASSRIKIPKGYQLPTIKPIESQNVFGKVSWQVIPTDQADEIDVLMEVVVNGFILPAAAYGELKTFMGWVAEARNRSLVLERSR